MPIQFSASLLLHACPCRSVSFFEVWSINVCFKLNSKYNGEKKSIYVCIHTYIHKYQFKTKPYIVASQHKIWRQKAYSECSSLAFYLSSQFTLSSAKKRQINKWMKEEISAAHDDSIWATQEVIKMIRSAYVILSRLFGWVSVQLPVIHFGFVVFRYCCWGDASKAISKYIWNFIEVILCVTNNTSDHYHWSSSSPTSAFLNETFLSPLQPISIAVYGRKESSECGHCYFRNVNCVWKELITRIMQCSWHASHVIHVRAHCEQTFEVWLFAAFQRVNDVKYTSGKCISRKKYLHLSLSIFRLCDGFICKLKLLVVRFWPKTT